MKRVLHLIAFFIIAGCVVQIWIHRGSLLFYFFEYRHRPPRIVLNQHSAARVVLHYSSVPFFQKNIEAISNQIANNLGEAEEQLGYKLEGALQVYLFSSWEEKGNYCGDIRIAHAEAQDNSIYCIVNQHWNGLAERPEFLILLQKKYGSPVYPEYADFVTGAFSGVWFGKTLEDWTNFLISRNLKLDAPSTLTDHETSQFIRYPWGAMLARFIQKRYGLQATAAFYKNGTIPPDCLRGWNAWIGGIHPKQITAPPFVPEFQKGVSYAYWNSYDAGYPTKKSEESVRELQQIGVNWIAAIPYGLMRSDSADSIGYVGHHIAGESDESLWALAAIAKEHHLKIMLKPQIWVHHASWPGKIDFDSKMEWDQWLNQYEKWLVHYAIIAELTKSDLFCIGTELVQATLKNPERWRALINQVRQIYHGPLTYAANWGKEFEQITFWDALDYIGVDNYYPVRSTDTDGILQMKSAFAKQKTMIESYAVRYGKPVLFTEIGYMANSKAGMGPREYEAGDSDYNETAQETCYRLALETYWNEPWFAGMYWWKWFSTPEDSGRSADAHSPHGRLAEQILKKWYSRSRSMDEHAR